MKEKLNKKTKQLISEERDKLFLNADYDVDYDEEKNDSLPSTTKDNVKMDYREMYFKMFNAITAAMHTLKAAQMAGEENYINSGDAEIVLLEKGSKDIPCHKQPRNVAKPKTK